MAKTIKHLNASSRLKRRKQRKRKDGNSASESVTRNDNDSINGQILQERLLPFSGIRGKSRSGFINYEIGEDFVTNLKQLVGDTGIKQC